MSLLTAHALWNVLKYYQVKLSLASPLIPDDVIAEFTQPHLTTAVFAVLSIAFSLSFFFRY